MRGAATQLRVRFKKKSFNHIVTFSNILCAELCTPKPTVVEASTPYWPQFEATDNNVLTFVQCEAYYNYYLSKDGELDREIIIDLGCETTITKFILRNTVDSKFARR